MNDLLIFSCISLFFALIFLTFAKPLGKWLWYWESNDYDNWSETKIGKFLYTKSSSPTFHIWTVRLIGIFCAFISINLFYHYFFP